MPSQFFMLTGNTTGRNWPPVRAPVTAVASAAAVNWLMPEHAGERGVEAQVAGRPDALRVLRDRPVADLAAAASAGRGDAGRVEQLAGDVRVEGRWSASVFAVSIASIGRGDVGVGPTRAAEPLGEDGGTRVGDRVGTPFWATRWWA